jgi:RNA polymerase sigma factor (sigma-70 family)
VRGARCNAVARIRHLTDVTVPKTGPQHQAEVGGGRLEFAVVYRENVRVVTAFFARRLSEPQEVADLTSHTFVEALRSASSYRGRGTVRAWLIGIARHAYASHVAAEVAAACLIDRIGGQLVLAEDEIQELAGRIDAARDGSELLRRTAGLSDLEREAVELVDLVGLTPTEAARVLDVSANTLRVRLFRAHQKLRKKGTSDDLV